MKNLEEETLEHEELLNIANELGEEDTTIEELKKYYPNKTEKLNEALLNYMGENDLKNLKTEFPEKRRYLTKKLAYPYEFFSCIEDYQKSVENIKKEDFFSKFEK